MDSLLANYASSSDEEKEVKQPKQHKTSSSSSLFSSLPPPSSTSTSLQRNRGGVKEALRPSSFSSLPPPSSSRPKRVVEFRPPPINQSTFQDDEEDEEADREQKRRKESQSNSSIGAPSVKSFLSTIPAPKNSFSSLGGGRRSAIDTQTPISEAPEESKVETHPTSNSGYLEPEAASYAGYESGVAHDDSLNTQPPTYSGSEAYGAENHSTSNYGDFDPNAASYVNYETVYDQNPGQHVDAGYGSYEGYGHQNSNSWGGGSMAAAIPHSESALRILGKRSKIPAEIVEVKQDELMKNRPREDQSKMTGIAFGPSYQPVSSKGKPTKLHKRKHQIGSLFFDMKQKETELAERRSKGFLTKAETHAKYGW